MGYGGWGMVVRYGGSRYGGWGFGEGEDGDERTMAAVVMGAGTGWIQGTRRDIVVGRR